MDPTWRTDRSIPDRIREGLIRFCDSLRDALGGRLESIALYGSLAKGDFVPGHSDVNVAVVLAGVTVEALDLCVDPVTEAARDIRLSAMILTVTELRSSCDVFPVKFLDMQRWHRTLVGKDVLLDLTIRRDHLRLRCEQEIKNLTLRLRRFYVMRSHRPELVRSTLEHGVSALIEELRVVLHLRGQEAPAAKRAVAEAAGKALNLDTRALLDALELRGEGVLPDPDELRRRYGAFMAVTARAAEVVDRM